MRPLLTTVSRELDVADSTTVNLFKAVAAALSLRTDRACVVIEDGSFPTDRYIVEQLATQVRVTAPSDVTRALNADVALVVLSAVDYRTAAFADGSSVRYDQLITTIPLDRLVAMTDLAPALSDAASDLRSSSTHVVGIGVRGSAGPHLAGKCWIYFPEANCPFYRVTHFSHYSPLNVPDITRHWSLMAGVSESSAKPVDASRVVDVVGRPLAEPAAWPIAMHVAIERAEAWASCVAEKHRPATSNPSIPSGSRHRYGIPYTPDSGTYVHLVSGPAAWSSIGAPQSAISSSKRRELSTSSRVRR